jgi:hypothetical protein
MKNSNLHFFFVPLTLTLSLGERELMHGIVLPD